MYTLSEMIVWAKEEKRQGRILNWGLSEDGRAISIETDQGWCPSMFGSDTEPDTYIGADDREDLCINF